MHCVYDLLNKKKQKKTSEITIWPHWVYDDGNNWSINNHYSKFPVGGHKTLSMNWAEQFWGIAIHVHVQCTYACMYTHLTYLD